MVDNVILQDGDEGICLNITEDGVLWLKVRILEGTPQYVRRRVDNKNIVIYIDFVWKLWK